MPIQIDKWYRSRRGRGVCSVPLDSGAPRASPVPLGRSRRDDPWQDPRGDPEALQHQERLHPGGGGAGPPRERVVRGGLRHGCRRRSTPVSFVDAYLRSVHESSQNTLNLLGPPGVWPHAGAAPSRVQLGPAVARWTIQAHLFLDFSRGPRGVYCRPNTV